MHKVFKKIIAIILIVIAIMSCMNCVVFAYKDGWKGNLNKGARETYCCPSLVVNEKRKEVVYTDGSLSEALNGAKYAYGPGLSVYKLILPSFFISLTILIKMELKYYERHDYDTKKVDAEYYYRVYVGEDCYVY